MSMLKQRLLTNWHVGRILRMAAGLMLAYVAIDKHDALMGLFSAFFLFQGITEYRLLRDGRLQHAATRQKETGTGNGL